MIPVSKNEVVSFTDEESGIVFKSMPIVGENEKEFYRIAEEISKVSSNFDVEALSKLLDPFIDTVLIGWDAKDGIAKFPEDKKPSAMFRTLDKVNMFKAISKENKLTVTEQKN